MTNVKTLVLSFVMCVLVFLSHLCFGICHYAFAQGTDLELNLDVDAQTIALPNVFRPNIDLSGRDEARKDGWPQGLAAAEVLDIWQRDIGFTGVYRLQYNLWEIYEAAKTKDLQEKLLNNYESIFKKVTDAGGVVIVDIFGMPPGLGRVLDKISAPRNLKAFKETVKALMRNLSCEKKYNVWYEIWSAPDREDFFLGRRQDYLNLYKVIAEAAQELQAETKMHIPLGGPASSSWFQSDEGNTIVTPERSLIYSLIKFCSHYRLPLDFISWHGYSSDPQLEKETTFYKKNGIALIRDWLSYFRFDRSTLLIADEWNYDTQENLAPERAQNAYISASYVPSRIKNMSEAGLDYQLYFTLEDFQSPQDKISRNTGIFSFNPESTKHPDVPKATYNVFRMLARLGSGLFYPQPKLDDPFVGAIATKSQDYLCVLVYNYIDPYAARDYISRNNVTFSSPVRKSILRLIKANKLDKIIVSESELSKLRADKKLKALLAKAQEINAQVVNFKVSPRNIKININGLKDKYIYQRYKIDLSCSLDCEFSPIEEKEIGAVDTYQEILVLNPYSVNMIILKKKPEEPKSALEQPAVEPVPGINNSTR